MTRDEAIERLNIYKSTNVFVDSIAEAIDMAIEALKGGDAEVNETKSPYMQQSRHDDGRMTKEQAVKWVKFVHDVLYEDKDEEIREALDMAIEALSAEEAVWNEYEAEFTDLPDIPRYYYEKVVGKMAHEINVLKEQLESADAVQGEWIGYNADKEDWLRTDGTPIFLVCDKCHGTVINNGSAHWNFCPNCGARMEASK